MLNLDLDGKQSCDVAVHKLLSQAQADLRAEVVLR